MPAVISGERRIDFDVLRDRAIRAAAGFRAMGVGEADCVALFLRNDVAFFEAALGASLAGAYPVPINWHATAEEAAYILDDCQAKALVVHADLLPGIEPGVRDGLPALLVETPPEIAAAYGLGGWPPAARATTAWDAFVAGHAPLADPSPVNRSAVIYTSGTTGKPKGVRRQPPAPGATPPTLSGLTPFGLDQPGPIVVLMNGPMYHAAPNIYGLSAVFVGADIVLQARFDAEEMLALIERHRVTHMHIVPTMFVRLLKLPEAVKARYDLSSLRFVVHGAAPCPPEVKRAMIDWWGPVINEYYGSSETGLAAFHTAREALERPGTVGRPLPGVDIVVVGDDGRELGVGEVGELYIRPANLPDFTYIGADDKRREVGRGAHVTVGDVGWIDADGYVFLSDRKRDMVISGGVNIYPAEIEAVLVTLPGVRDCAVFGVPDDEFGEALCAYVEPLDGADLDPAALRAGLAGRLSRFKVPKTVKIVPALPREDSGKIFKRKLRDPYWAGRGRAI
ncbi:MAG: acyl-CoA synthetase [Pseudomonadota bacterium]